MARSVVPPPVLLLLGLAAAASTEPRSTGGAIREVHEDCTPRQVHIALGEDPTKMHVSWKTAGANCRSEVTWWRDDGGSGGRGGGSSRFGGWFPFPGRGGGAASAAQNAVGYSFLLSERDMCEEPAAANEFQLYLHRAVMTGLTPGADYRYALADGAPDGGARGRAAEGTRFRAQPAEGGGARGVKFVAFGDLGESSHAAAKSPGARYTLDTIMRQDFADGLDLVLHVGDISYADGNPDIWDSFMDSIEPLASRVPYMVQVGNHEYGYRDGGEIDPSGCRPYAPSWGNYGRDSGGECGAMLARRFHMPSRPSGPRRAGGAPADNPPFWYAFSYGPARFVAVSTEHDLAPGSPQHAWLEAELAAADRCVTPWLVVLMHRPAYVVYPHKSNRQVGEHIRASLEGLFSDYYVDLVISGHVHSYYRTCAVYDEACVDDYDDDGDDDVSSNDVSGSSNDVSGSSSNAGSSERRAAPRPALRKLLRAAGSGGASGGVVSSPRRHGAVHVVVGSAGRKLSDMEDGQEDWVVAAERTWGYTRFEIDGPEVMAAEFVESETGRVLDRFEVRATAARRAGACPQRGGRGGAK